VDVRKLTELREPEWRARSIHGHEATKKLRELVRAYEFFSIDMQRTMVRTKAIFRGH